VKRCYPEKKYPMQKKRLIYVNMARKYSAHTISTGTQSAATAP